MSLQFAREVIDTEIYALQKLRGLLDGRFVEALDAICAAKGRVIMCGMGKAGHIARKISATMASTGTPSFFMHPAEALHGDLGMVEAEDVCVLVSNSGESAEITHLLPGLRQIGAKVIAVTGNLRSTLAAQADVVLWIGAITEACPLGLAPSATTTAMLALGDALALCLMKRKNFQAKDFAAFHPGGALGRRTSPISAFMRQGSFNAMVRPETTVADTLLAVTDARSGAAAVVNPDGGLAGIFCDGDLRRGLKKCGGDIMGRPVRDFMTADCAAVRADAMAGEVLALMRDKRIAEIPVVDAAGKVVGMADLKSLVASL